MPELSRYLENLANFLKFFYYKLTNTGHFLRSPADPIELYNASKSTNTYLDNSDYVLIYPCLQMKKLNCNQDAKSAKIIWNSLHSFKEPNSEILLCTGYFNIRKGFESFILKSKDKWKILTSSPKANSFYNSNGMGYHIPYFYQYNFHKLAKKSANISAYEFQESMQTFHAKGNILIYFGLNDFIGLMIRTKDGGTLSSIGSPNFGYRSEIRDNELQFYLMSTNKSFNLSLKKVALYDGDI